MKKRIFKIVLAVILIYAVFGAITTVSALKAVKSSKKAVGAFKLQDLNAAKAYLKDAKGDFKRTKTTLLVFTPLRIIPVVGWYVGDVQRGVNAAVYGLEAAEIMAEAITPYADILGLAGDGTFLGGTAQERLAHSLEALSKVTPQIDDVGAKLSKTRKEVDKIKPWRYPNILPGNPGAKIQTAQKAVDQVESLVVDTKPLLLVLPQIMGQDGEKKYLILFQNDKELRPTGGFITAYAFFRVQNGVITAEGSEDIYKLDDSLLKRVPAPQILAAHLNVSSLNLRDSNLSPDYLSSIKTFEDLYQYAQDKKEIDGIIALDTHFVLSMMDVLGPIEAYDSKFTTDKVEACDCPQIIYELERYADEPKAYERGSRKGIIGVLMQQMMDKGFNAPKSTWPNLLEAAINNLRQKHLILYFHDQNAQGAVEKVNFAGRLYNYDGDYLHINEANLGGAKSNLYVQEKVKQQVKKADDGKINKKITIEYKYPREIDNCSLERTGGLCLAGVYRDWIRIYVPKGSTLIKASGTETPITASEDLGKTVFEGFFTLRPTGSAKIELEYEVPLNVKKEYKLLIQKQPGTEGHTYEIEAFGKKQKPFQLETDKEFTVKL